MTSEPNDELAASARSASALEESEQRIRLIIGTALDAVITMDARGVTTGWSVQAAKAFGWSRDEAGGRPRAALIIPGKPREAHARECRRVRAHLKGTRSPSRPDRRS